MASSLISDAPTFTTTQCSICDLAWDLLPFECVCNTLPLITAPPYVYNPDAVHLTPTANVADVYAQCDVCGESGCECEWPRDSDGNLIPADEFCHLCYGNLMQCDCDDDDDKCNAKNLGKFSSLSLWEAAIKAFDGNSIPNKFTIRCHTPFQEDYTRILICSSDVRYEVYNYHIPEKKQHVLFYVTYDLATTKSTPQKLPTFIDATFLPTCINVHDILLQLDIPLEDAEVGIWGPAPLQDTWYELTLQEALGAPILDGQPSLVHDKGDSTVFEDIPCILIM